MFFIIEDYLLEGDKVDWKKLRDGKMDYPCRVQEILDEVLDYLKSEGKVTSFLGMGALVLFRPDDFDMNPLHAEGGSHWYFTEKGIDEARAYIKDFLPGHGARICSAGEWVSKR